MGKRPDTVPTEPGDMGIHYSIIPLLQFFYQMEPFS